MSTLENLSPRDIEGFLFGEAEMLDSRRFNDWLALFTPDCRYWVPNLIDDADPSRHVSIVYDDHRSLTERVWRLESGLAYAQEPQSRTCRSINNIRITDGTHDTLTVRGVTHIAEYRRNAQTLTAGHVQWDLVAADSGLQIRSKTIDLISKAGYLGNLSILL